MLALNTVAACLLTLAVARACGGSTDGGQTSGRDNADDLELRFARCMRFAYPDLSTASHPAPRPGEAERLFHQARLRASNR